MSVMPEPGRLVARILPKDMLEEYSNRHPKHQIDVEPLFRQLVNVAATSSPPAARLDTDMDTCKDAMILIQASIVQGETVRKINLQRSWNEPAENTFKRLSLNLSPDEVVRRKGKQDRVLLKANRKPPSRKSKIFIGEEEMDFKGMTGSDVWMRLAGKEAARIEVPVAHTALDVMHLNTISCAPIILSVNTLEDFEASIFSGVPLVVKAKLHHATQLNISWFVNGELRAENAASFTPTIDDIGKHVSVLINPGQQSTNEFAEAYQFLHTVQAIGNMPFVHTFRSEWTCPRNDQDLRIMSYNVLADQYTSKAGPKPDRMAYCSSEILHRGRRMPLLMHEILSYKADIICLQEVDCKLFQSFYHPILESQGYRGFFTSKITETKEGCALFWSNEAFEIADEGDDQKAFAIRHLLAPEDIQTTWEEAFQQVKSLYTSLPRLENLVNDLGQVLQLVRLTSRRDSSRQIVVGNTHLYYHPYGDHIRALQTLGICQKLDEFRQREGCPVILTGDFNSNPGAGAIDLLLRRNVDPTHHDAWKNLLNHPQKRGSKQNLAEEVEVVEPPTLCLPSSFPTLMSAYTPSEESEFTHHVEGFFAILDHIFLSESDFEVCRQAPLPTIAYMPDPLPTKEVASDHISLVCDVKWKH